MDGAQAMQRQRKLTEDLLASPYDTRSYLQRANFYERDLGLHDLAAGDAYKALLLTDEILDESGEHHEQACEALQGAGPSPSDHARQLAASAYRLLVRNLVACGCLQSAYTFSLRGLAMSPKDGVLAELRDEMLAQVDSPSALGEVIDRLPARALVPAMLYPWNEHEPDRFAPENLEKLNASLRAVAPKLEVRATNLPVLSPEADVGDSAGAVTTVRQLGLFAASDLSPGELLLQERSLLAVGLALDDPVCDCCGGPLSANVNESHACPDCDDTVFCCEECQTLATESYHSIVCGKDVETVARGTPPAEAADALYLLLLTRAIALAESREAHILDLDEVRFLWGDFVPENLSPSNATNTISKKLPFSFEYNVQYPLHVLEKMDLDIFATVDRYDIWMLDTVYAKFRAVANGSVNRRTGRPEVCAVHPLWCLANHSCAPNVRWEWGGEIKLWARRDEDEVNWGDDESSGKDIKKGEEIVNHYCDIELNVKARREWMMGSLGGICVCQRCVWESSTQDAAS